MNNMCFCAVESEDWKEVTVTQLGSDIFSQCLEEEASKEFAKELDILYSKYMSKIKTADVDIRSRVAADEIIVLISENDRHDPDVYFVGVHEQKLPEPTLGMEMDEPPALGYKWLWAGEGKPRVVPVCKVRTATLEEAVRELNSIACGCANDCFESWWKNFAKYANYFEAWINKHGFVYDLKAFIAEAEQEFKQ